MEEYRILVVGAGAVGKSSLTYRFIQGNFPERVCASAVVFSVLRMFW
jgi:GTPase SAR1 family protein